MTKNSKKNQVYLKRNGLEYIHVVLPDAAKKTFDLATRENDTDMSKVLRKFIYKYNSAYINRYAGQKTLPKRAD